MRVKVFATRSEINPRTGKRLRMFKGNWTGLEAKYWVTAHECYGHEGEPPRFSSVASIADCEHCRRVGVVVPQHHFGSVQNSPGKAIEAAIQQNGRICLPKFGG